MDHYGYQRESPPNPQDCDTTCLAKEFLYRLPYAHQRSFRGLVVRGLGSVTSAVSVDRQNIRRSISETNSQATHSAQLQMSLTTGSLSCFSNSNTHKFWLTIQEFVFARVLIAFLQISRLSDKNSYSYK